MQSTERYEKVAIDKLVPYTRNARTHSKEQILQLRASLREFGFVNPVIVDKDLNIIAGHGRVMAAKAEGLTEIPCVFAEHLTDAQKRAYILADNRLALNAGWDEELLALEFGELKDLGFDLELTGFDANEIEKLFSSDGEQEAEEDNFDVDGELEKPAFSMLGDIWTLGRADGRPPHRLICGDSTKSETLAALMQGNLANLILTALKTMEPYLAGDGAAYIFHADTKGLLLRTAFNDAGFKLAGTCIWVKNTFVLGHGDYHWGHEPCLYGWKASGKHVWHGDRKQSTVWNCDKPARSEKHPTMKPIPLLAIPVTNSTQTNGIVLEPFGGSGSTLICCEQLGRVCYASELDEKFVDVIVNRYRDQVGGDADIFVERNGETLPYAAVGTPSGAVPL